MNHPGRIFVSCAVLFLALTFAAAGEPVVVTIAGSSKEGNSGDGGLAQAAALRDIGNIVIDSKGNLYFVQEGDDDDEGQALTVAGSRGGNSAFGGTVRKIDLRTGIITTAAGNGEFGFSGDGGPATAASFDDFTLAVHPDDTLFIVDSGNNRIRRVDSVTGIVTTVAGNGEQSSTGDGGQALNAAISSPGAAAFDAAGNLYFTETSSRIRKIDTAGIISTIAGTGSSGSTGDGGLAINATIDSPEGIAVDAAGDVFFVEDTNPRVRKITAATGLIGTVAGNGLAGFSGDGGLATAAQLGLELDIALDAAGNLYIGDGQAAVVRKVDFATGLIKTVAGNGSDVVAPDGTAATATGFVFPSGFTVDDNGAIYIGDLSRIRRVGLPEIINPLNDIGVSLLSSQGGLVQLAIDIDALPRATPNVETNFDGVATRVATAFGTQPSAQFASTGVFVASSTATDAGTGGSLGRVRKTLTISGTEINDSAALPAPDSTHITLKKLSGKFLFNEDKPDVVSFSGEFVLSAGLNTTVERPFTLGIGNVLDTVTVDAKGKATGPSTLGRISKFKLKYPKAPGGITQGGQKAQVQFTLSIANLDTLGFDTEGITAERRDDEAGAKTLGRQIQVALNIQGVGYEAVVPVAFKLSSDGDAGGIAGRAAKK